MLGRLFSVLLILTGLWPVLLMTLDGGIRHMPAFLVVGLGPIVVLLVIRYVLAGFSRD